MADFEAHFTYPNLDKSIKVLAPWRYHMVSVTTYVAFFVGICANAFHFGWWATASTFGSLALIQFALLARYVRPSKRASGTDNAQG